MRLRLKNFRQHEELALDLPATGLILLKGVSGAGKTTIFDAFYEAVTGEADDVTPWGGSSSLVELHEFQPDWLKITRTRGPKTLTLTTPDGDFKDEAAQAIINKTINDFMISSYIQQELAGSLLKLGAADQLRYIQALSSIGDDPEAVRERIAARVRAKQNDLDVAAHLHEAAEKANLAAAALWAETIVTVPKLTVSADEMITAVSRTTTLKLAVDTLTKEFTNATQTLQKPVYETIRGLDKSKERASAVCISNDEQINKSIELMKPLIAALKSEEAAAAFQRWQRLPLKHKRLEVLDAMNALRKEIQDRYQDTNPKASEILVSRNTEYTIKLLDIQAEYEKAKANITEMERRAKSQNCPACNASLAVEGGKIILDAGFDPEALQAAKAYLDRQIKHRKAVEGEIAWILQTNQAIDRLKKELPIDNEPDLKTMADVAAKTAELHTFISDQKKTKRDLEEIQSRIDYLQEENTTLRKVIGEQQALVQKELAAGLEPEATVLARREEMANKIEDLTAKIKELEPAVIAHREFEKAAIRCNKEQAIWTERQAQSQSRLSEAVTTFLVLEKARGDLAAALRLKERSDEAAVSSIELTIEEINSTAKPYIDRMFPEDGTTIRIKNLTQTKAGDQRAKISLEIFHKGKVVSKLRSLSGGEKSRIYLAFQLAMSEMYKSPILLVDEGFTGLSEDDKSRCLEVLKDFATERLVMVIEHGAPEAFFDQVIQVG